MVSLDFDWNPFLMGRCEATLRTLLFCVLHAIHPDDGAVSQVNRAGKG